MGQLVFFCDGVRIWDHDWSHYRCSIVVVVVVVVTVVFLHIGHW